MIRIVVTGSECTGKTTLTRALARHYGAPWVPEYSRQFVREMGRAPRADDVAAIARGQIAAEDAILGAKPALVFQDTDLLSTVVYSGHYYGSCPGWVEAALRGRPGDLYLLAGIDVPWVPDGEQRDRSDRRDEMQNLFRRAIADRGLRSLEVSGPRQVRLAAAIGAVDPLLARS